MLHKHVTGYKKHQLMAEGEQVNSNHFLVKNQLAKPVRESVYYRQFGLREQSSSLSSVEDPLNQTDAFLLSDFDALDEGVQAAFNSSTTSQVKNTTNCTNNVTSLQDLSNFNNGQGLVNVQVTPEG